MRSKIIYYLFVIFLSYSVTPIHALEGIYLAFLSGYVNPNPNFSNNFNSGLGAELALGLHSNSAVDFSFHIGGSYHGVLNSAPNFSQGSLDLLHLTSNMLYEIIHYYDTRCTIGLGPGFYAFLPNVTPQTSSQINFGINTEIDFDGAISDSLFLGLGYSYHFIFGNSVITGNFWQLMARLGIYFDLGE